MSLLNLDLNLDSKPEAQATKSEEACKNLYRIDVWPLSIEEANRITDPILGETLITPTYWIQSESLTIEEIETIAQQLLIDPVLEHYQVHHAQDDLTLGNKLHFKSTPITLQKQFLPGVTDNLANSIRDGIHLIFPQKACETLSVFSGQTYHVLDVLDFKPQETTLEAFEEALAYQLYNPLIESLKPLSQNNTFQVPTVGSQSSPFSWQHIPLRAMSAQEMAKLSENRCLALSADELVCIQAYYQHLGKDPSDVELEILAQTWSEHCKHKIFNAQIHYIDRAYEEYEIRLDIDSLFKTYISGPTKTLIETKKRQDLLSIFVDNAGVVQWDNDTAICFKVETHNSPSALEPYGGALTGIVGVNRDILGTGLGAKPLFNTDVFCFAHPDIPYLEHPRLLPPEAILKGVRKGVEDGGNKSGIPTVNGGLFFDPRYRAKPLVFCGTGGIMPITLPNGKASVGKYTQVGDAIIMVGGRVGKDGIHGATFSSEALHEGSPVSAVQIGDPLTQKRVTDFLQAALEQDLITGITDNGAGGLSSSVGEMAELTNGARVDLAKVPLKYPGLHAYEIIVSESQERMTLSSSQSEALLALAKQYQVEATVIGEFTNTGNFEITVGEDTVASLALDFLHNGLPKMQLNAVWDPEKIDIFVSEPPGNPDHILLDLLAHPNICSREALVRQYDHEVQGRSVIKPYMGPEQMGPCDAAVLRPKLNSDRGLVVSNGLCPNYSDWDPYHMAACAVDEAIRNAVAVGADPTSIALLDNFCWPDPIPSPRNHDAEHKLAQLVRACMALKDSAESFEAPFISGKDSMKNDFDDGETRLSIPPTLLISAIATIPDVTKAISMNFKHAGDTIYLVGRTNSHLGGSQYYKLLRWQARFCPQVNFAFARERYKLMHQAIQAGWIQSCHDLSEGGLSVSMAECVIGSEHGLGADIDLAAVNYDSPELRWDEILFSETPSRFIVSVKPEHTAEFERTCDDAILIELGTVTSDATLRICHSERRMNAISLHRDELTQAWRRPPSDVWKWEALS
jgi:phosphoribosylformylglycinamidine synthase subunit PurSL